MATRDLARLAKTVKAQRMELYPSRAAAADAAGISKVTWQKVEEAHVVREVTYAKMDAALGWATGSCAAVAEGDEPVPVEYMREDGEAVGMVSKPSPEWHADDVRQVVADSAMLTTPGLSIGELRALSDRIVEELKKRGMLPEAS